MSQKTKWALGEAQATPGPALPSPQGPFGGTKPSSLRLHSHRKLNFHLMFPLCMFCFYFRLWRRRRKNTREGPGMAQLPQEGKWAGDTRVLLLCPCHPCHRFYVFLKHIPRLNTRGLSTPSSPGPAAGAGLGGRSIQADPSPGSREEQQVLEIPALRGFQAEAAAGTAPTNRAQPGAALKASPPPSWA